MAEKKARQSAPNPRRFLLPVRLLIAAALGWSAYLAWAAVTEGGVAGCGPASGCDQVLQSRWSVWLGVPVSFAALALYAAMFGATLWLRRPRTVTAQRRAWTVLVPGAVAVLGAVLWFVTLQLAVIKAVCPYCMAAHFCGALAAVLILVAAPIGEPQGKPWQVAKQVFLQPSAAWKLALAAGAGVAVLIAGQVWYQPKLFTVAAAGTAALAANPTASGFDPSGSPTSLPPAVATNAILQQPGARQPEPTEPAVTPPNLPPRIYPIYGGILLNLREVPLIGSPDAPYVMVSLFDYSCHHCRLMHGHLMQVHRSVGNQLAIINLPVPLSPACNFTVQRTHPDHVHACDYARIGLAVWRTNRGAMGRFDDWIFTPEKPPAPAEVRAFAEQLVGSNALHQALNDRWIDRQLEQGVSLYATNYLHLQQSSMPQLIIGSNLVTGVLRGPEDLYPILGRLPGLVVPKR